MTSFQAIYKCKVCGNIVEVLHAGVGELVCCVQPMTLITENTMEASKEKHVPVVEAQNGKVKVQVGSTAHPMEKSHFIEWIQIIEGEKSSRKFLKPEDEPVAEFASSGKDVKARAYCNLHGLWRG